MQTSPAKTHTWIAFRDWMFQAKPEAIAGPVMNATPAPLNPEELRKREWSRLVEMVDAGTGTALAIKQTQTSASQRIDAAGYALDGLRAELADAMKLAAVSARAAEPSVATASSVTSPAPAIPPRIERPAQPQPLAA